MVILWYYQIHVWVYAWLCRPEPNTLGVLKRPNFKFGGKTDLAQTKWHSTGLRLERRATCTGEWWSDEKQINTIISPPLMTNGLCQYWVVWLDYFCHTCYTKAPQIRVSSSIALEVLYTRQYYEQRESLPEWVIDLGALGMSPISDRGIRGASSYLLLLCRFFVFAHFPP